MYGWESVTTASTRAREQSSPISAIEVVKLYHHIGWRDLAVELGCVLAEPVRPGCSSFSTLVGAVSRASGVEAANGKSSWSRCQVIEAGTEGRNGFNVDDFFGES